MAGNLVIVESPAKARTLNKHLGKGWVVKASLGHVRDLPKTTFGVDIENGFTPKYQVIKGKAKLFTELKKAARTAEKVFLAPDPDREGEAIAWHIAHELTRARSAAASREMEEKLCRVVFHELTGPAITQAFAHPGSLDEKKVNAQQARRVLDRIVGYQLSPLLWKKVRRGLSAGRVQSVALRLICDREQEIRDFVSEEYWSLTATLEGSEPPRFPAKLERLKGKKVKITDGDEARRIHDALREGPFTVTKVTRRQKKKRPVPPFITSHLQQEAYRRLGFTARQTMRIAQQLYEGLEIGTEGTVGLITYMRTDSPRVAGVAQQEARDFIGREYGSEFLPAKPPHYRGRKSAQEAHEAIRPTSVHHTPERMERHLDRNQARLYRLIWQRFLASQMEPARYDQTSVDITSGDGLFRASGSVMTFPGFTRVYEEAVEENGNGKKKKGGETRLPPLKEGETLTLVELEPKQHFTQPPPRFTEATLVRELEEKGIGRPSTYAAIMTTIQHRDYTRKEQKKFHPTDLGELVNALLVRHFPDVLDPAFTAALENRLDEIEEGRADWRAILQDFYGSFSADLDEAAEHMKNVKAEVVPTDVVCAECGRKMVIRWGKNGRFLACPGYPECRNTMNFTEGEKGEIVPEERPADEPSEEVCDKCGAPMVVKTGRYGKFLACSAYPKCRSTRPIDEKIPCPVEGCTGTLRQRLTKRRRRFYSCSRYPECKFAAWDRPVAAPCPQCGSPTLLEKISRDGDVTGRYCPRKEECGYRE